MLAERHDVDVVVDEDGDGAAPAQAPLDVEAVPPGHDRRVHRPTCGELDRPRNPDPDRADLVRPPPCLGQQRRELIPTQERTASGTFADREVPRSRRSARRQIGDRNPGVGGAEVGGEHHAGLPVELEHHRRPPTLERPPPASYTNRFSIRASTRCEIVERPRPVAVISSARVIGPSCRMSSRIVPGPIATRPIECPFCIAG